MCIPDRIYFPYNQTQLVLLGARHHSGVEYTQDQLDDLQQLLLRSLWPVRRPRTHRIDVDFRGTTRPQQIEAIKTWVAQSPEFKGLHEGVVCRDPKTGKRLKVKTPLYCATHLQGNAEGLNLSSSRVAELIANGDAEEFCLYAQHLVGLVQTAQRQVVEQLESMQTIWEQVKTIDNQKDFACAINGKVTPALAGLLFEARKTNQSPISIWASRSLVNKTRTLEKIISI